MRLIKVLRPNLPVAMGVVRTLFPLIAKVEDLPADAHWGAEDPGLAALGVISREDGRLWRPQPDTMTEDERHAAWLRHLHDTPQEEDEKDDVGPWARIAPSGVHPVTGDFPLTRNLGCSRGLGVWMLLHLLKKMGYPDPVREVNKAITENGDRVIPFCRGRGRRSYHVITAEGG